MIHVDLTFTCDACGGVLDCVAIPLNRLVVTADAFTVEPPVCWRCWPGPGQDTHTALDESSLTFAGVSPSTVLPRERAVHCSLCGAPTWHLGGRCDNHYMVPHFYRLRVQ